MGARIRGGMIVAQTTTLEMRTGSNETERSVTFETQAFSAADVDGLLRRLPVNAPLPSTGSRARRRQLIQRPCRAT